MNKNKFYALIILVLLISNCFLVGFFIFRKPPHLRGNEPKYFIIERLGFDENQILAYENLIHNHRNAIDKKSKEIEIAKNELYLYLSNPEMKTTTDSLFRIIANNQTEIERIHFNHFKEIKTLCRNDQVKKFNQLTKEIAQIFERNPPKHR